MIRIAHNVKLYPKSKMIANLSFVLIHIRVYVYKLSILTRSTVIITGTLIGNQRFM